MPMLPQYLILGVHMILWESSLKVNTFYFFFVLFCFKEKTKNNSLVAVVAEGNKKGGQVPAEGVCCCLRSFMAVSRVPPCTCLQLP